jgi:uncharacterized protein (DUF1499 family)
MRVLKAGPVASVVVLGVALGLLALAPLGSRLGWWHHGFGLYRLFPASGALAVVAAALSLATLVRGRSALKPAALAMLALSLVASAGPIYAPLHYAYIRRSLPPINDVSTDTADRPRFQAVLTARAAESVDRTDTPEPNLSRLQRAGYPDLAPVHTELPIGKAFSEALAVAASMPGWAVVAADADAGRIEASQRSRWFSFTDDIVIRVAAHGGGSRIDMRSASRKGTRDYGVNAARIRAYMGALKKRIG